jgi:hypothetical protein
VALAAGAVVDGERRRLRACMGGTKGVMCVNMTVSTGLQQLSVSCWLMRQARSMLARGSS